MVRWLAVLFWLFSFSTWKAFFVRVFSKPPSPDHLEDGGVDELESSRLVTSDGGEASSSSVSPYEELSDCLADLPSEISSEESVVIGFSEVIGPLTADDDAVVKESMKAIATSTVLKELVIIYIWPCSMEGIAEALLANQSVERLRIDYVGKEVVETMSRVLLENKCLKHVNIYRNRVCNQGAASVSDALRRNRTLKSLWLGECEMNEEGWKLLLEPLSGGDDSNTVLEKFRIGCVSGVESQCGAHIGNMVRRNTSLHSIGIGVHDEDVATSIVCGLGEALFFNTQLSHLEVRLFRGRKDDWKGLWSSLIPDSQGQQANTTVKSLVLDHYYEGNEIDSLANMLQKNTSLVELRVGFFRFDERWSKEDVIKLLEALKSNKCLELLDLSYCKGVEGGRVLGTIMDLFLENHHLKKIVLDETPLSRDGSVRIIEAVLEKKKNARLWEVVQGMATTTPTSARVFLCGDPYAGKTTLRKTIMDTYSKSNAKPPNKEKKKARWWKKRRMNEELPSTKSSKEERTRGIEVHNLSHDNIDMTIWDMAGQEEYHAFHDLVVPNLSGGGSCCSFILVCNPQHDFKTNAMKGLQDVVTELTYWFKFIASNTRISALYRPHVKIVFTHVDLWSSNDNLFRESISDEVQHLKQQFQDLLDFQEYDFFINAVCKDSAQCVFLAVVHHLHDLLQRVPKSIQACTKLQKVVVEWTVQNPNDLLLDWEAFSSICDGVEDLSVSENAQSELTRRRKEYVATSLHDSGHLIFHEDLKIIIMNPHLFCHDIMGELISRCMNKETMSRSKWISHGCITKDHLQKVLSSLPTAEEHKVSFDDVLKIMLKLELCYEQVNGRIMIPSTLEEGSENMSWKCERELGECNYIGRRLVCNDSRTQLSPGFFPRLQVSFQKEFEDEKTYKIMKDLITFIYNGMEIIIEYSGSLGFGIDIMISSDEDEEIILDFLHERLIKHIFNLCGHPTLGCPGIRLIESIIRPACVRELVPCKFRTNQAVLVEYLKQRVLAHVDLSFKYTWKEEGPLPSGYDNARTLLGYKMWDDVLNQFMADLKKIEHKISRAQPSEDHDDSVSSFNVMKATKPPNATCDDVWDMVNAWGYKHYVTQIESKDEVLQRLDKLSRKMEGIHMVQKKLMSQVCKGLEELMTFTVEFQQHKYPRLAYFKQCGNRKGRSLIPGMKHFVLHLMCEHKDGFHIVEDQEGCLVSFGNESTEKFKTIASWMLKVMTLIVKVGAHVGAGMGSMVPDLEKVFCLIAGTLGLFDGMDFATTKTLIGNVNQFSSSMDEKVAQQWLIDLLKANCKSIDQDIRRIFNLQKVKYNGDGDKAGSIAWICNKHLEEGMSSGSRNGSLEPMPSGINS